MHQNTPFQVKIHFSGRGIAPPHAPPPVGSGTPSRWGGVHPPHTLPLPPPSLLDPSCVPQNSIQIYATGYSGLTATFRYANFIAHNRSVYWHGWYWTVLWTYLNASYIFKQGVALTGRNRTVGRPTAHAPGGRLARPPAALQTTTDDRYQQAKQYWPIRRASNNFTPTDRYHYSRLL